MVVVLVVVAAAAVLLLSSTAALLLLLLSRACYVLLAHLCCRHERVALLSTMRLCVLFHHSLMKTWGRSRVIMREAMASYVTADTWTHWHTSRWAGGMRGSRSKGK